MQCVRACVFFAALVCARASVPEEDPKDGLPSELFGTLNRSLKLSCLAKEANPTIIYWFRGIKGPMVLSNEQYEVQNKTLTIKKLTTDALGEYACYAYNKDFIPETWEVTVKAHQNNDTMDGENFMVNLTSTTTEKNKPEECTDNSFFANCSLIVKGRYCNATYYARLCCESCSKAGQLSPRYEANEKNKPKECIDNPLFANCSLIVKAQFCYATYYARFCCETCFRAGQLPSGYAENGGYHTSYAVRRTESWSSNSTFNH